MPPPSPTVQWLLLAVPTAIIVAYVLTAFPAAAPMPAAPVHPSLASLPRSSPSWTIYPDDFYDGGAYADLPQGKVRYWLIGPADGERIVLVHGLSIPAFIWKDVAPQLAAAGFRVLLYDLYGRGYSDAPQTEYATALYTTQLALLLQYVGWERAHVAGVSMGGGVAAAFSAHFPHLCTSRLALIASAGLIEPRDLPRTTRFLSFPLVQSLASTFPVRRYLRYLAEGRLDDTHPAAALVRMQSAYLSGFNPAVASSLRVGPITGLAPAFAKVGAAKEKEVLLVWGTSDNVVPIVNAERVRQLVPQAKLVEVEGAGHELTVTHADVVGKALVAFFRGGQ